MNLHGIYPPITTPFTDAEDIDFQALGRNLQRWMTTGISGVVVLGSNGEAPYLGDDEAYRVIATAREQVPRDRWLIAGAGAESTRETIAAVDRAADAGADVVLVRTPGYFKSQMTADVFVRHYTAVADASRVPVLLYDAPMFTGVTLPVAAVATLAQHANIIGLKESAPDIGLVADFIANTPSDFQVLVGSAPTLYASLCVGAVGGIVALACVTPDLCVRLLTLVREGRHHEAITLQRQLTPLARSVTATYGVGGLKAALELAGYVGGRPRLPLVPPSPQGIDVIRGQFEKLQVLSA
ncbi:MAG: dihydrodipicolinate synthase family protein [Bacteroidales bacterium]